MQLVFILKRPQDFATVSSSGADEPNPNRHIIIVQNLFNIIVTIILLKLTIVTCWICPILCFITVHMTAFTGSYP